MKKYSMGVLAAVLSTAFVSTVGATETMTKEMAIEKATQAHPGELIKAYQETKKGVEAWEVKIKGDDGKVWEVYYKIADGSLLMEKEDS